METPHPVDVLAQKIDKEWPNIVAARARTAETLELINRSLLAPDDDGVPLLSKDEREVSVVAFGSLARQEFTQGSDLDWTLLIDGRADPDHLELKKEVGRRLERVNIREPGQEGTFGEVAFSHDLVHQIGGDEDTNRNTTRRCLMLLESVPLGEFYEAYSNVIAAVLTRYLTEDPSFEKKTGPFKVPRFLLNDFARYWRTMAVDFAYKRRKRFGKGAALRVIKLRISRKMLFASGLLSCFACQLRLAPSSASCSENAKECIQCLGNFLRKTPLEIVALYLLRFLESDNERRDDVVRTTAAKVFGAYDDFLGVLEDADARDKLNKLEPDQFDTDPVFRQARQLSKTFNEAILSLFFDLNDDLCKLTRFYGVF